MSGRGPLVALCTAHAVSATGNVTTVVALPLYVLGRTGSASLTGLAAFCAVAPVIVGGAFGGSLVDRAGYRRASIVTDLVGGAAIIAVPLLAMAVGLPLWALFALVFATNLFDAPGETARSALLPELAARAGLPLERATGIFEGLERMAKLTGGPLAGVLVAWQGPLNTFLANGASFVVAAGLVWAFVLRTVDARDPGPASGLRPRTYWGDLRDGLAFLYRDRVLRAMTLLLVATNAMDAAFSAVMLPIYASDRLGGAVALGLLISAMGLGALAGSFGYGFVGHRFSRRSVFLAAFLIAGGPRMVVFAAEPPFWVCLVTVGLAGVAAGTINPIISTVRLERTPPGMRGRVLGSMRAAAWAAMPVGVLVAGLGVDLLGLDLALLSVGACYLVVAMIPLLAWPRRSIDLGTRAPVGATEAREQLVTP